MSFWRSWNRREKAAPPPKEESQLDTIKRIARDNWLRERMALEARPRIGAEELATRVSRLNTVDDVRSAYPELKGSDFCDAVASAVKSRQLSGDNATFSMYLREWVRTGAHLKSPFPDWLESEGRAHFLKLNDGWLKSGVDPHVSFEEWLCSQSPPPEANKQPIVTDPIWGKIASIFDRNNPAMFDGMLEQAYRSVYGLRDDPRLMAYHASMVCGVAVAIRMTTGTNMSTLKSPVAPSSISQLTNILDGVTEETVKWLSTSAKDDPRRPDSLNKMYAFLVWRGYLLALSTSPSDWGSQAIAALSALKLMMTADPALVTGGLREDRHGIVNKVFDDTTRAQVKDDDWPPSGYVDLFFRNHSLIERKCRALFGTFD